MRRTRVMAGVIALAALCTSIALADDSVESAKVELSGGSAALGVGGNWGSGVLTFEGYQYPFFVRGLAVGDLGAAGFTGTGTVNNLRRAEDFNGNYTGLGAGLTIAGGGSAATMRNQNGVTIHLVSTTRGLKITLALGGIHLEIPESGFVTVRATKAAEASAARAEAAARSIDAAAARTEAAAQRTENIVDQIEKKVAGSRKRSARKA